MTTAAQFPQEQTDGGAFERQEDAFRDWVTDDGSSAYGAQADRYHLYVSLACPWAHRTILIRKLKRLEAVVGMTVVDPVRDDAGWAFTDGPGHSPDPIHRFKFLAEAYQASDPETAGRVTVPVLWDRQTKRIVNNSEDDITYMLNSAFDAFTDSKLDIYPQPLRATIDPLNAFIYTRINNGVYKAGFATSQDAYEAAVRPLFDALDTLDTRLEGQRYLLGNQPLEPDWRLFMTLIRFDAVYHGHFKCNLRAIADYPNLSAYLRDLYQIEGVAETVNFDHIKRHYYVTHDDINPTRIVPSGPIQNLMADHGRHQLGRE